ncbi:MAG: NifU family protein [Marinilabiliaceae bacterium]|nr:NifU family protein [Marinilabiliaceae bacterium]
MPDKSNLYSLVEEALNTIRPYLNADGGDITLIEITDEMVVKVRLNGACHGCPMSTQTLKGGVEMVLKQAIPEIISVEAV